MAHNTAVVPHAWTIISNSWKLDLSFDCFKTTITSESKAFSSKRSNRPWKQNSCEFCLHIKVGSCYKITPHSSRLVIYKMQNLVAFLLPQMKHFLLFSGREYKAVCTGLEQRHGVSGNLFWWEWQEIWEMRQSNPRRQRDTAQQLREDGPTQTTNNSWREGLPEAMDTPYGGSEQPHLEPPPLPPTNAPCQCYSSDWGIHSSFPSMELWWDKEQWEMVVAAPTHFCHLP